MTIEAISQKEPFQKLAKLGELFFRDCVVICCFVRFLVEHSISTEGRGSLPRSEIVPQGFVNGCIFAIHDLQEGRNRYTGKAIASELVGQSDELYARLRASIPDIADIIFPADFAEAVRACYNELGQS